MINATHSTIADKLDALESHALNNKRADARPFIDATLRDIHALRAHAKRTSRTNHTYLNRISRHATALSSSYHNAMQHTYAVA